MNFVTLFWTFHLRACSRMISWIFDLLKRWYLQFLKIILFSSLHLNAAFFLHTCQMKCFTSETENLQFLPHDHRYVYCHVCVFALCSTCIILLSAIYTVRLRGLKKTSSEANTSRWWAAETCTQTLWVDDVCLPAPHCAILTVQWGRKELLGGLTFPEVMS